MVACNIALDRCARLQERQRALLLAVRAMGLVQLPHCVAHLKFCIAVG